jgi:cell division protein FtsI/penicillin-binding protein 2
MRFRTLAAVLSMLLIATGVAACSHGNSGPDPDKALTAFVNGWRAHSFNGDVNFVDANDTALSSATVTTDFKKVLGDFAAVTPSIQAAKANVVNKPSKLGDATATSVLTVTMPVDATHKWTYQTTAHMNLENKAWHIRWEPALIQPSLIEGATLRLVYKEAERGKILSADGSALMEARSVVDVGIQPSHVTDLDSLVASLAAALKSVDVDIDVNALKKQVRSANPDAFVEVVTLRAEIYQQIRSKIHDLPGTVFNEGTLQLAPKKVFAHALLGEVDTVTKEQMDKNPGKYHIGDHVGAGGLEQAYEDRLRGTDGVSVVIPGVGKDPDGSPNPPTTVFKVDPAPGKSIKVSIDPKAQNAADAAVQKQSKPTGFIAMQISTGQVIAVANGPSATGQNLAMQAQVPPGSIFKMVTAANVLESGAETPNSIVNCPATLTVNGRVFKNSESEALGKVPLITDFAKSCNTAFASLYPKLGKNGLAATSKQLGIGGSWNLGVPTYTGSVPDDGSDVDQAAAAFGQGKTLVSPAAMIGAVAAVARGQWKQPTLVLDPAANNPAADGTALKPATVASLKSMMKAVTTSGTAANRMKGTPGGPVYAKTGTAQYDANPDHTHAWFIGYQGDIAFAVLVVGGGMGATAAAPIAKSFLTAMAG